MALSSSEHELLTTTCTNMNVAANTCREVLEMLRSLGNTGVVDIAMHNNAATAHSDATNLVHYDSGEMHLGTKGSVGPSSWSGYYPYTIKYQSGSGGYHEQRLCNTNGNHSSSNNRTLYNMAFTDSSGNVLDESAVDGVISNGPVPSNLLSFYATFLRNGAVANAIAGISAYVGSPDDYVAASTNLRFTCGDGSTKTNAVRVFVSSKAFAPYSGQTISLGMSSHPFETAYLRTAATVTSDRRGKDGIESLGSQAIDFVKALRPVQYTVRNGKTVVAEADENGEPTRIETEQGIRTHWGLIAQEVKEALSSAGIEDAAVWCLADKDDPDSKQSLRYEELIAPMIKVIQQQQERIEALERKVA